MKPIFIRTRTVFIFLFLAGLIVYLNSFDVPFHYDDIYYLKENLQIKSFETLWIWFSDNYSRVFTGRPFLLFTFFLNYKLGGLDTFGYHFLNLTIHIINAFLLYIILFRYADADTPPQPPLTKVGTTRNRGRRGGIAVKGELKKGYSLKYLLASVIFLIHPINTESVTYISSRSSVLSAFFVLISILCFFKAMEKKSGGGYYLSSIVFFLLGLSTKEAAIVTPILIILFDICFVSDKDRSLKSRLKYYLPFFIIIAAGFLYYAGYITRSSMHNRPWLTHILTELKVFTLYLKLLFMPFGLNIDHDIRPSTSVDIAVIFSFIVITGILLTAFFFRRKNKVLSFSILWFFINLIPFLAIRIEDFMAERWVYLASIGFSTGLAGILVLILNHYKKTGIAAISAVIVILGILTPLRNQSYSSWVSLWEDAVKKSPDNIDPYLNLSVAYREGGNPAKSVEYARGAIEKGKKRGGVPIIVYINLSAAYEDMGEYEKAIEALKSIEEYSTNNYKYYHNLGSIYMKMKQCEKALPFLEKAVQIRPNAPGSFFAMGGCYEILSQEKKAREYYKRVTESVAQSGQDYIFQGIAFSKLEDKERAIGSFFDAVQADPLDVGVRIFLGNSLLDIRQFDIAFKHYSIASEISPQYAPAYTGMGKAMLATGNLKEARKHFNKALSLLPPGSPERKELLELLDKTKG